MSFRSPGHQQVARQRFNISSKIGILFFLAFLVAFIPHSSAATLSRRAPDPPKALPQLATENDLKWQPALDYDGDGCYNVPAIDSNRTISEGLPHDYTEGQADCRDESDLDNSNAYSRQRCNSGWCVYLYDYYFEKDVSVEHVIDAGGHRHDWEHIAVWVKDDGTQWYVCPSAHGNYDCKASSDIRWDGNHPKIVYHKDGGFTHAFRFATGDDEPPENHKAKWIRSPLVSYNGFPSGIRDKLFDYDFGKPNIAIKDQSFVSALKKAIPTDKKCPCDVSVFCPDSCDYIPKFDFDYGYDKNSPGNPNPPEEPNPPKPYMPNLRIQPLGDSITKGSLSSDGNGYRSGLRQKLEFVTKVDMIGTLTDGTMADNSHEGHSGEFLATIKEFALDSTAARPNVVLLHAGTNNMDLEVDLASSSKLLREIIIELGEEVPDATIIVAKIILANDARMQKNTDSYNTEIESLVKKLQDDGKHVLIADMSNALTVSDLADKKHPNNGGYQKMAQVWYDAIIKASEKGWLSDPKTPEVTSGVGIGTGNEANFNCEGGNWESQGTIFQDLQTWEEKGEIAPSRDNGGRNKVILADINGDGLADYILADDDGLVRAWVNNGPGGYTSIGKINPRWQSVEGSMIRMADIDNDKRADMIVLYSNGAAKVWRNTDNGKKFEPLDSEWATGLETGEKVHITDLDGDGYADYVIVYSGGAVKWSRNTQNNGKDPSKRNWEATETIAPGVEDAPADSVHMYDFDGDGKADYLVIHRSGRVRALRNTGNLNKDTTKRNWEDWGTIVPGVSGVTGEMIRFADIDGDGVADFLSIADDGSMRAWKNNGVLLDKKESLRFADLTGNGRDDIISVNQQGRSRAWLNQPDGSFKYIGQIAPGPSEDLSGSRIVFVDVNGDRLADYIIIYAGGAVKAYLNNGKIEGPGQIWQEGIVISPGLEGVPGSKIELVDVTGNGLADFLVIWDGGTVVAYLNNGNIPPVAGTRIWQEGYTISNGVGQPGRKVRFADITGDGPAEYLVVYDGGAIRAQHSFGSLPGTGTWESMGTIASGVTPQGTVRLADINGDGKMDYLTIFEDGHVNAYINKCSWTKRT